MPNLKQIPLVAIAIVTTAVVSIFATAGLAKFFMFPIPVADKPASLDTINRFDGRLTEALGNTILCIEEVQALRKDWKVPQRNVPLPAVKKAGG